MPGLYIHMDVARKALSNLTANAGAADLFSQAGPTAAELETIAANHPAHVALGAIGPDMFFLLPDFKPPFGTALWGAANTIKDLYEGWDNNFLEPWEATLGPIGMNTADELGSLTGGLITQLGDIASQALQFLIGFIEVMLVRQYDVFGLLGSGVPDGYDEQTFYWSDMFHYRKTFQFGRFLFTKAQEAGDEEHMAFALGWLSHLATDVTGHAFTNEKCGGPYRLHWQRHKLVENHMDAVVVDSEHGADPIYNMLNNSALHLWVAFNPDGTSRHDFFNTQPGPAYSTGDATPDILDRQSKWDVDSDLPAGLAEFLAGATREFYTDARTGVASNFGAVASHPTIIEDNAPGSGGYADPEALTTMYWWVYKYLKWTTTDYYKLRRPEAPDIVEFPPFPSPPGSGTASPGPGESDDNAWSSSLELLLSILAWLTYLVQVLNWGIQSLISMITTFATYPLRLLVYEFIELPLYHAFLAVHWYLAHSGFLLPMTSETNPGLMTLGTAPADAWITLQAALDDLSGGLVTPPSTGSEPSGGAGRRLPREPVVDDPALVSTLASSPISGNCSTGPTPSEFLRPWLFPSSNLDGTPVLREPTPVRHSPYPRGLDATVLTAPMPGSAEARQDFENAHNEEETLGFQAKHLPTETLGGPIDYTGYVVAKLTRDNPGRIANFNLDSDRGYGYLCWDWVRDPAAAASPSAYQDSSNPASSGHQYPPPKAAGYGWCPDDVVSGTPPAAHDPAAPSKVRIRYIDREGKF